jgi:DNA-binding NarL/FixJ family response regulator
MRWALERRDDVRVVAEAADGHEAVAKAAALEPEVVILDLEMHGAPAGGADRGSAGGRAVRRARNVLRPPTRRSSPARPPPTSTSICQDDGSRPTSRAPSRAG